MDRCSKDCMVRKENTLDHPNLNLQFSQLQTLLKDKTMNYRIRNLICHSIVFNNVHVIDKGNFRMRKILEPWHTAITIESRNNSKPLPMQTIFCSFMNAILAFNFFLLHTFSVYISTIALFIHNLSKIANWHSKALNF